MSITNERKSKVPEELESELEDREEVRREDERSDWEDLNQGMQTGTHDVKHRGIKWGPSYRTRRKPTQKS